MTTGYLSSSAIQQIFTSGPYSGSVVTSSYYNGTNLSGPIIDYKEYFISGTADVLSPCVGISYFRILYDPITCPPGGCVSPILTSAEVASCTNYNSEYNITYNSSSTSASYTIVQYGTSPTFMTNTGSVIYNNSSPSLLPINVSTLPFPPASGFTSVYFRSYNSCSNGNTSSFSNTLEATCYKIIEDTYQPFNIKIQNHSGQDVIYNYGEGDYLINNMAIRDVTFSYAILNLKFSTIGIPFGFAPVNANGNYNYAINVSSSIAVEGNVTTEVLPVLYNSAYLNTTIITGYTGGGENALFDADGINFIYDVDVNIDRSEYLSSDTIILTILPNFSTL